MNTFTPLLPLPLGAVLPPRTQAPTRPPAGKEAARPQHLTVVAGVIVAFGLALSLIPAFLYNAHPVAYLRAAANGQGSTTTSSLGLATPFEHRYRNQAQPDLGDGDPQVARPVPDSGGRPLEAP
jgi:hypothetical protein